MKNLELMLAKHPFLHGLSDEYIREIAGHAMIFKFDEGDILFDEGEPANKFYLIIKGKSSDNNICPKQGHHYTNSGGWRNAGMVMACGSL